MSLSSPRNQIRNIPVNEIRAQFPALNRISNGSCPIYFDGPGGTQTPQRVIDAIGDYLQQGNSNLGGMFSASHHTEELVSHTREHIASLINAAAPHAIFFGANMTTMTFHLSRSISQHWQAGDNIILSELDHAANRTPWELVAKERGVNVQYLTISGQDCQLSLQQLEQLINHKTRLVAITGASNITGTINPLKEITQISQASGVQVYIDAVHLLPHHKLDVQAIGCDYLVGSAYKFFGPHTGFVYGESEHLKTMTPYKVTPAPDYAPNCWETGTLNFECLAGVQAAVDYIASLGTGNTMDEQLRDAYNNIVNYEQTLATHFLAQLQTYSSIQLYGLASSNLQQRTPTFALTFDNKQPRDIAEALGKHNICTWSGHLYADSLIEALHLTEHGGILRAGLTHYNTVEEIDRFFEVLETVL